MIFMVRVYKWLVFYFENITIMEKAFVVGGFVVLLIWNMNFNMVLYVYYI